MTFESKNYYEGDWVNGKQEGHGTLYNKNEEIIQTGEWKRGEYIDETPTVEN